MSKKKILAIALSLVMVLSLIPHGIFAAAQDDNSWQIVSGKYVDNTTESKTAYPSTDPEIRIQKNVIPTAVENEFQVYMAIDAKCMEYTTST
ncbi:MAG: hypothetical protein IIU22_03940, partial [Firmicutes bacterium]|nr:hypothetical protein [Bacillota bacterium]